MWEDNVRSDFECNVFCIGGQGLILVGMMVCEYVSNFSTFLRHIFGSSRQQWGLSLIE